MRERPYHTLTPGIVPRSSRRSSSPCRARKRPKAGLYVAPRTGIGSGSSAWEEMLETVAEDIGEEETVEESDVS